MAHRDPRRTLALAPVLALAALTAIPNGCGGARGRAVAADQRRVELRYDVRVAPALDEAEVRVCFTGTAAGTLGPAEPGAVRSVREARLVRPGRGGGRAVAAGPRGIDLAALRPGECLLLAIPLDEGGPLWARRLRAGAGRVVFPQNLLWAPRPLADDVRAELTLHLPAGVQASVPWPALGPGRYRLDRTALAWRGFVALGPLAPERVALPGGVLDVARLGGAMAASPQGLRRWLEGAGRAAASLLGRLAAPRIQVLVVPVEGGWGDPVLFGATARGGGPGVILFVSARASDAELVTDWVAPHELTHLALPVVPDADAWMSEGFATYYAEVLRARAGLRSPAEAWQALARGCARGLGAEHAALVDDSATMHQTQAYARVYWGGAALALTADVELRRETRGRTSLDTALRELARCCLGRTRAEPARALLSRVPRAVGGEALRRLVARAVGRARVPPIERTFARLGVTRGPDGAVLLSDDAPDAWIREAITRRSP